MDVTSGWELGAVFKADDGVPTATFGTGDPQDLNSSEPENSSTSDVLSATRQPLTND